MNITGKSDLVRKIADKFKLKLIDIRLSQADPTDLSGFPSINNEEGKNSIKRSYYAPPEMFPLENDELPDGYAGWLIFFDEMSSAPISVQAASYKVILDKEVGQHKLHKKVVMMCAGNKTSDRAIVNRLSTAMQSRLIHLNLAVDHKIWLQWANDVDLDYRVKSFINFKPDLLHSFNPKHEGDTFPAPRTWSFLSDIIKPMKVLTEDKIPLIAGTIGEGSAYEFFEYSQIFGQLPTLKDLLADPDTIPIPDEPSILYAMSTMLGMNIDENNVDVLINYINRMPAEFQTISLKNAIKKNNKLLDHSCIEDWIIEHSDEFT